MQEPEIDLPSGDGRTADSVEPAGTLFVIEEMRQRLATLEQMTAAIIGRIDQLQHLAELSFAETHARRRDDATKPQGQSSWSSAGFPLIPRNIPVFFGTLRDNQTVDVDDILVRGWYTREEWGVWGQDSIQELRFAMDGYGGGYATVHLALQCFVPPGMSHQNIDILANGYFLGSFDLPGGLQIIKLRLPPSCICNGDILLQTQQDKTFSPAAFSDSLDTRVLGIGLISLDAG